MKTTEELIKEYEQLLKIKDPSDRERARIEEIQYKFINQVLNEER